MRTANGSLQGGDPRTVRTALDSGDPLPGTGGFAGALGDRLVRDVLGRYPLFVDTAAGEWAFDPDDLAAPRSFPAGHARRLPGLEGTDPALDRVRSDTPVWTLPDPDPYASEAEAVAALTDAIDARGDALAGVESTAVAFSGGVDSALVAALVDGPLYVAGLPDSHDREAAATAADALDRAADLRVLDLSLSTIEAAVPRVARAIGRTNPMDVAIALPLVLVAERAAADGNERLAVGQGADELFGGYAKVANAPDDDRVEADTVRAATRETVAGLPDELERDVLALRSAGVEPLAPLLHDCVVRVALRVPEAGLVDDRGRRKHVLRLAARRWVPDGVAAREKKALQYGSLVARELDRLARRAGFKRRMDDHVGRYVRSRVGGSLSFDDASGP